MKIVNDISFGRTARVQLDLASKKPESPAHAAGLSGRVRDKLQLRGGVRLHNFAGEELSTTELFIASGIRFDLR